MSSPWASSATWRAGSMLRTSDSGHHRISRVGEGGEQLLGGSRRRWDGHAEGHHQGDLRPVPDPALGQVVVHQQRRLARCRRALERRGGHPHDDVATVESRQYVAQGERTGDGVELVGPLDESGRRLGVEVRAQRHDEHVGVVGAVIGHDPLALGVDRGDVLLDGRSRPASPRRGTGG